MHIDTEAADEACPALADTSAFKDFFQCEGYVVVRNALPRVLCEEAVDGFLKEVHLDNRALFLRHAPCRYEPHVYTDAGRMRHPIIDLQDISGRRYPQFKGASLALLSGEVLQRAVHQLLDEPACLLRTMYADGSHAPWAPGAGAAIGAWIAAEDLAPGERRPGVPLLQQGDLLLWTLSAAVPMPGSARRAFSGHFAARARIPKRGSVTLGGMEIVQQASHRSLAGRAAGMLRARHPRICTLLARLAA